MSAGSNANRDRFEGHKKGLKKSFEERMLKRLRREKRLQGKKASCRVMAALEGVQLKFDKDNIKAREINRAIETFVPEERQSDAKYVRKLKRELLYCRRCYLISYSQYFIFGFEGKSDAERKEYIGERERQYVTISLYDRSGAFRRFKDKYLAYEAFRKFYGREIIKITSEGDRKAFKDFAERHKTVFVKPADAAEAKGIYKVEAGSDDLDEAFDEALAIGEPAVAEEAIVQDPFMAAFHPGSVNTVRITTFATEKRVRPLFAFLRTGCGDSIVDNAGAGGMSAAIDIDTGVISTQGFREDGTCSPVHPDTQAVFMGTKVPRWGELLNMLDEMARVIPEQIYVGWDMALTPDGWKMIEGNSRAMMTAIQMCEQKGLRPLIEDTFYREMKKRGIR